MHVVQPPEITFQMHGAALECDPVSAYGGIIVTNVTIDEVSAAAIDKIFFEVIIVLILPVKH